MMADLTQCVICYTCAGTVALRPSNDSDHHQAAPPNIKTSLENVLERSLEVIGQNKAAVCENCVTRLAKVEEHYQVIQAFRQDFYRTQDIFIKANAECLSVQETERKCQQTTDNQTVVSVKQESHPSDCETNPATSQLQVLDLSAGDDLLHADQVTDKEGPARQDDEDVPAPTGLSVEQNTSTSCSKHVPNTSPECKVAKEGGASPKDAEDTSHPAGVSTRKTAKSHLDTSHACKDCGQRFKQWRYMRDHQRRSCKKKKTSQLTKPMKNKSEDVETAVKRIKQSDAEVHSAAKQSDAEVHSDSRLKKDANHTLKDVDDEKGPHIVEDDPIPESQSCSVSMKGLPGVVWNKSHSCPWCPEIETFESWDAFQEHKLKEHRGHRCETCGVVLRTKRTLELHVQGHLSTGFKCKDCGLTFKRQRYLRVHRHKTCKWKRTAKLDPSGNTTEISAADTEGSPCPSTEVNTPQSDLMSQTEGSNLKDSITESQHPLSHLLDKYAAERASRPPIHKCPVCRAAYSRKAVLEKHVKAHHWRWDGTYFTCHVCMAQYSVMRELQTHIKTKHPEAMFKCLHCEKAFRSRYLLDCHRREKHGKEIKQGKSCIYSCPVCAVDFPRKNVLHEHMKKQHLNVDQCDLPPRSFYPAKCFCGKRFVSPEILETHMVKNHPQYYECPVCNKSVNTHRTVTRLCETHAYSLGESGKTRKRKKNPVRSHLCYVCGYSCVTLVTLQNHMISHEGVGDFKCDVCERIFVSASLLENHKYTHTKPFECDICGKTFGAKINLGAHKRRHTNEKPYNCQLCDSMFRYHQQLKRHLCSVHQIGEKIKEHSQRAQCLLCNKKFLTGGLPRHFRQVHPEVPYERRFAVEGRKLATVNDVGKVRATEEDAGSDGVKDSVMEDQSEPITGIAWLVAAESGSSPVLCKTGDESETATTILGLNQPYPTAFFEAESFPTFVTNFTTVVTSPMEDSLEGSPP